MNKTIFLSVLGIFVILFISIFFISSYFNLEESGLFIFSSKKVVKTTVTPDLIKKPDLSYRLPGLVNYSDNYNCSEMINTIKEKEPLSPVLCVDYDSNIDKFSNKKIVTAFYFLTKYGAMQGCIEFEDECLGNNKVLDKFCGPEVNYDDFELAFYNNVKKEFIDINKNSVYDYDKIKVVLEQYNLPEDTVFKLIAFIINEPRLTFFILGPEGLNKVLKKTIDEKVILDKTLYCFSDSVCKTGQCEFVDSEQDLSVGEISKIVKSNRCKNTFEFEICNSGENVFVQDLDIELVSNSVTKNIKYYNSEFGDILPGECVLVSNDSTNINYFNLGLSKDVSLTIKLDSTNLFSESSESNNTKTELVYTGDNYYFDSQEVCETWCFDSDGSKPTIYQFSEKSSRMSKQNGSLDFSEDYCGNELMLVEMGCVPYYNQQSLLDSRINFWQNCNDLAKELGKDFGYCNEGICEFKNFDEEINSCYLKNLEANDIPIYPYCSYISQGVVHFFNEDYFKINKNGCLTENTELTWSCTNIPGWKLNGFIDPSCPKVKISNSVEIDSETKVCNTYCDNLTNKCFYDENIITSCYDSDGDSSEIPGFVTIETIKEINDDGNLFIEYSDENYFDDCFNNGNTLRELTCNDNELRYIEYTNLSESNKGCIYENNSAKLVDLNNDLKFCNELQDFGLNEFEFGMIEYRTNKNELYTHVDECIGNGVSEVYCGNDEPKFEMINCDNGCKDGVCQ